MDQVQVITTRELNALLQAADADARLLELVHGELVEKMPTEEHGKLAALIAYFLLAFIRPKGIAGHVGVEVRHETPDDHVNRCLPDVSLRLSDAPPVRAGAVAQMPDLAVDIQSPDERPHQMRQKALYYLQKSARVVWLIYPAVPGAELCTLQAGANLALESLDLSEALTAEPILPGFALPLHDLFTES